MSEKLFEEYLHLAKATADRFWWITCYGSVQKSDLRQVAAIALWKASIEYDFARDTTFKTFAIQCMRYALISTYKSLLQKIPAKIWRAKPIYFDISDPATEPEPKRYEYSTSIVELLSKFPTRTQSMVVQWLIFDETFESIAAASGTTKQNVQQIVSACIKKLRPMLLETDNGTTISRDSEVC